MKLDNREYNRTTGKIVSNMIAEAIKQKMNTDNISRTPTQMLQKTLFRRFLKTGA